MTEKFRPDRRAAGATLLAAAAALSARPTAAAESMADKARAFAALPDEAQRKFPVLVGAAHGDSLAALRAKPYFGGAWLYLLAVAVIAGRMHGLGVLMHEAAHFRFLKIQCSRE